MNLKSFSPLTILFLLFLSISAYSQEYDYVEEEEKKKKEETKPAEEKQEPDPDEDEPIPFKDRIFFGGNLGFQFGDITFIDVSPLAGYKITERLHGGLGISYQYFSDRRFTNNYSTTILGWRTFGRYMVTQNIFPHVEYESLSVELQDAFGTELARSWYNSVLAGIGVAQPIGRRGAINALVLYNLSYSNDRNSLYASPWVTRIGFIF